MSSTSRSKRPVSVAASFFRRNGQSHKESSSNRRESVPPVAAPRTGASSRPRLDVAPDERGKLADLLGQILSELERSGLGEDGLFVKDPSAASQDAMIGIESSQREPMVATRQLLDAFGDPDSTRAVLYEHNPYIWAVAVKAIIRELPSPLVPSGTAVALLDMSQSSNEEERIAHVKRVVAEIPRKEFDLLKDLCLILHDCPTDKDKLGHIFSAIMVLPQVDAAVGQASTAQAETIKTAVCTMIRSADEVFGRSVSSPSGTTPRTPATYDDENAFGRSKYTYQPPSAPPPPPMQSQSSFTQSNSISGKAPPPPPPIRNVAAEKKTVQMVRCVYDFDPVEEDELELRVGDEIEVLEMGSDGWWRGRNSLPDGTVEEGYFPVDFVEQQNQQETSSNAKMANGSSTKNFSPLAPDPPLVFSNTVPPSPQSPPTSLQNSPASQPLFQGSPGAQPLFKETTTTPLPFGKAAPPPPPPAPASASIKTLASTTSSDWGDSNQEWVTTPSTSPIKSGMAGSSSDGVRAIALFDFEPEAEVELRLVKGQDFLVIDQSDPDWWKGRTPDGREGLFPHNYAQLAVMPVKAPPPPPNKSSASTSNLSASPVLPGINLPTASASPSPPPSQLAPLGTTLTGTTLTAAALSSFPVPLNRGGSSRTNRPPAPPPPNVVLNTNRAPAPPPPSTMGVTSSRIPASLPVVPVSYIASAPPPLASIPASMPIQTQTIYRNAILPPTSLVPGQPLQMPNPMPMPPGTYPMTGVAPPPLPPQPQMMPMSMSMPVQNAQPPSQWALTGDMYQKYLQFFESLQRDSRGLAGGREVGIFLLQSGLGKPQIARILELADIDRDTFFDRDEFACAAHLALCVSRRGMPMPDTLPPYLIPRTKR